MALDKHTKEMQQFLVNRTKKMKKKPKVKKTIGTSTLGVRG